MGKPARFVQKTIRGKMAIERANEIATLSAISILFLSKKTYVSKKPGTNKITKITNDIFN